MQRSPKEFSALFAGSKDLTKDLVELANANVGGDSRILVLGPSPDSPFGAVTEGLVDFLQSKGLQADRPDPALPIHTHRAEAAKYSFILALPLTAGPAAEVVDFMQRQETREKLVVVMPQNYGESYLVKLFKNGDAKPIWYSLCGPVKKAMPAPNTGRACLTALLEAAHERTVTKAAEAEREESVGSQQQKLLDRYGPDDRTAIPSPSQSAGPTDLPAPPTSALSDAEDADFVEDPEQTVDGGSPFLKRLPRYLALAAALGVAILLAVIGGLLVGLIALVAGSAVVYAWRTNHLARSGQLQPSNTRSPGKVGTVLFDIRPKQSSSDGDQASGHQDPQERT